MRTTQTALVWKRYSSWTVNSGILHRNKKIAELSVRCDCGTTELKNRSNLTTGRSKSCGCKNPARKRHGLSETAEYEAWNAARNRCSNPLHPSYKDYGARGITMSDEWSQSFEAFIRDMGFKKFPNFTLERKNNNFGYSKENCIWADRYAQNNNTRFNIST